MNNADNLRATIEDALGAKYGNHDLPRPIELRIAKQDADAVMGIIADPSFRMAIFDAMGLEVEEGARAVQGGPVYIGMTAEPGEHCLVVRPRGELA